jgi:hypothetical protein
MATQSFEHMFDLTQGSIIVIASHLLPLPAANRTGSSKKLSSPSKPYSHAQSSYPAGAKKGCPDETLSQWMNAAELELTAFLHATAQVAVGLPAPEASDLWINVLNMTEWNGDEPEQFFRLISIMAAAEVSEVLRQV